jgi:hypothetical protein
MTWLSRLLPQSPNRQRFANDNHQIRQGQRRRRSMNLELLENRTLLSNVTVSFNAPTSALTITGDSGNDNFTITENPGGTVTVAPGATKIAPGVGLVPGSTINLNNAAFTTSPNPVSSIVVSLPGTTNFDFVTLTGQGKTTTTTINTVSVSATGANLNFAASSVDNSTLLVTDFFSTPVNAVLTATVTNSTFATLAIEQTGGGPDSSSVTLGTDTVPGSALVSLGNANKDSITLNSGNVFGQTALLEGNGGPTNSNSLGNSDTVSVAAGSYKNLSIKQLLDGTNSIITVGPGVVISPINNPAPVLVDTANPVSIVPDGVETSQGNGAGDTTTITGVTTTPGLPSPPVNLGPGGALPGGFVSSNINVVQGNGSVGLASPPTATVNDSASVTASTVPGNITITQTDLGSNSPSFNLATISGDTAGGAISISQGNAAGDVALVQGGAPATGSTFNANNVSITQGNNVSIPNGSTVSSSPAGGDVAEVNATSVFSDITILQGTAGATAGGYIAAIGFDYLGFFGLNPVPGSGSVSASAILIDQQGGGNDVWLGDAGSTVTTFFLDVFTGGGGGANVFATNTTVFFGPLGFFSPFFTIEGGGTGNTFFDNGGNSGVTFDPANFNS